MTHQQFAWGSLPPQKPGSLPPATLSSLIAASNMVDPNVLLSGLIKPMPQYAPPPQMSMPLLFQQNFGFQPQSQPQVTFPPTPPRQEPPTPNLATLESLKLYNDLLQLQALRELSDRLAMAPATTAMPPASCLSSPTSVPSQLSTQNSCLPSPAMTFATATSPVVDHNVPKEIEILSHSPSLLTPSVSAGATIGINLPAAVPPGLQAQFRNVMLPPPRPGHLSRPPSTPSETNESIAIRAQLSRPCSVNTPEEEEEFFVDVEKVDGEDAVTSRQRISAISEFNKKIKSLRTRGTVLECGMCEQRVNNNRSEISGHVYEHAKTKFRCKYCGIEYGLKEKVFEHIRSTHPNKNIGAVEDRRDMRVVCELLSQCFPRNPKPKATQFDDLTAELFKNLSGRNEREVLCAVCNEQVEVSRNSLKKHISHNHINYRCKRCKFTCADVKIQAAHCVNVHEVKQPENTVDFNACGAKEVLSSMMKQCFGKFMGAASP
ncbi:hypothetical protein L596_002161 [Steinernema carpocapsae]|uniref:C2H2-type domain-containing protein n=1 Tax=Steinernema carpocapsae TaxID=34508 RepID=A0A4U8UNS0_STECR|nr:hypothetical protein L596_002161 [Steinernema carpocapsae]